MSLCRKCEPGSSSRALCCLPSVGFYDSLNHQGFSNGQPPQPWADNPYLDLDYSGYHKKLNQQVCKLSSSSRKYFHVRKFYVKAQLVMVKIISDFSSTSVINS